MLYFNSAILLSDANGPTRLVLICRAVAAAPQTPQLEGPTLPKGAPNCLEGPEVASIQKQSFAWRMGFFALRFYIFQF